MSDYVGTEPKSVAVLIVDDSEGNRLLLKKILQREGYLISEASDGATCLEICSNKLPDLILLDVMMPGIDGFQVCSKLRESYTKEELPIILVSARADGEDIKTGLEAGASDYITKPIDRNILLSRLSNQVSILSSRRLFLEQQQLLKNNFEIQKSMGDALEEALVIHDLSGRIHYLNKPCELLCHTSELDTVSEVFEKFIGGKFKVELEVLLEAVTVLKDTEISQVIEISGKNKQYLQIFSKPILINSASLRLWRLRDVSNVCELEKAVNQQVRLETISMLSVGVAHNFNNILGCVLGATEVLKKFQGTDPRYIQCINIINQAVTNGKNLTKKMSIFVKKEAGNRKISAADLKEIIDAVVELNSSSEKPEINFKVSIPGEIGSIKMAAVNLVDILSNIVSNAVDAVDKNGEINIIGSMDTSRNFFCLSVLDNGRGMDSKTLPKIYEPFFSTKNIDNRNGMSIAGNGLGLWTVYNLLKNCDGDISIKSAPGQGTQVVIFLPLEETQLSETEIFNA